MKSKVIQGLVGTMSYDNQKMVKYDKLLATTTHKIAERELKY